jgi:hypothetical protein
MRRPLARYSRKKERRIDTMWFKKNDDEHWERYDALKATMRAEMVEALKKQQVEIEARLTPMPKDYAERIAELEVKIAKLWAVLTKVSNTGQEGPSRVARVMFGGKAGQR